ncbi:hypothetical protein N9L26_02580 [Candidatus Pacebacteria bacterium]|nr:hypothetical protein [Candidatus Paceibacterota bacterium]
MSVWRFIFGFLYVRDWHSGQMELSRPRVVLFAGMLSLIVLGILIALILQRPVTYSVGV